MSESVSLAVSGMKCGGCENAIKLRLSELDGVLNVEASHLNKKVDVVFDESKISVEEIEDSIEASGFILD